MSEGLLLPPDLVNVSNYFSIFNAHLLLCVDRQALPAASDLADFMLAKQLPVEPSLLQQLLQKLAKQNQWLRARELFKRESLFLDLPRPTGASPANQPVSHSSVRLAKPGLLPGGVGSPRVNGADGPLSVGRGGAGARVRDVPHRQLLHHPPASREHQQEPQHHSE